MRTILILNVTGRPDITLVTAKSINNDLENLKIDISNLASELDIYIENDRTYRAENPNSCGKYKYSKQYTLQEYKDELSRLRQNVSKNCGS